MVTKYANCARCGLLYPRAKLHRLKTRYSPFYCQSCLRQLKIQSHLERMKA
jgi:predicted SprT family Zn-dependent metalloprotease